MRALRLGPAAVSSMARSALVAAAAAATACLASPAPLTSLTDPRARCLDGTLSGFYLQAAPNASDATRWVVCLDGGGECGEKNTCYAALNTSLGSSKYFAPSREFDGAYLCDDTKVSAWHRAPTSTVRVLSAQDTAARICALAADLAPPRCRASSMLGGVVPHDRVPTAVAVRRMPPRRRRRRAKAHTERGGYRAWARGDAGGRISRCAVGAMPLAAPPHARTAWRHGARHCPMRGVSAGAGLRRECAPGRPATLRRLRTAALASVAAAAAVAEAAASRARSRRRRVGASRAASRTWRDGESAAGAGAERGNTV